MDPSLRARHAELLENAPTRFACLFECGRQPLESLRDLSRHWPGLTLLLDYEVEGDRIKGLAKAKAGILESYLTEY